MKQWFGWLVTSLVFVFIASYAWTHRRHIAVPETDSAQSQTQATYEEAQEARKTVTITGPMADYVARQETTEVETLAPISTTSPKLTAVEQVGDSPVGTSKPILHKTFRVGGVADLPFEIPAHASTPQLHGTYRSFLEQAGAQSSDSGAEVEFLLMNEKQFADLLSGRPGEATFSAEDAHAQEVNFSIPPTFGQPAKYFLVFRNNSAGKEKKYVQADFRVDF
jgi:hypothetical protein